jgi:hypothetical protein
MRAKFRCSTVTQSGQAIYKDGKPSDEHEITSEQVILFPVYAENGPNKKWSTASPSGRIEMTINNKAAFGHFKPGKCYYVDFFDALEAD